DIALRPLADRGHHVPDEGRLALLGDPRLEVVGGHHAVEAGPLRGHRQLDDLLRAELLEHRGIADLRGGHRDQSSRWSWTPSMAIRYVTRGWARKEAISASSGPSGW